MVPTFEEIQKPDKVLFKTIFEGYLATQTFKLADFLRLTEWFSMLQDKDIMLPTSFRNVDLYIVNSRDALHFKIYFKALEV